MLTFYQIFSLTQEFICYRQTIMMRSALFALTALISHSYMWRQLVNSTGSVMLSLPSAPMVSQHCRQVLYKNIIVVLLNSLTIVLDATCAMCHHVCFLYYYLTLCYPKVISNQCHCRYGVFFLLCVLCVILSFVRVIN